MVHLDFLPCPADPDVWLRTAKRNNGSEHYKYVLLYMDKILREGIGKYFELKESSIGPPDIYSGGKLRKVILENGVKAWAFESAKYIQEAVCNVETYLTKQGQKLPSRLETQIQTSY